MKNPITTVTNALFGDPGAATDAANAARKEDRLRNIQLSKDRAALNALFGITDYNYTTPIYTVEGLTPPDPNKQHSPFIQSMIGRMNGPGFTYSPGGGRPSQFSSTLVGGNAADYANALGDYAPYNAQKSAEENKAAREGTLDSTYSDIMNYYTDELNRQYGRKNADVLAMLADRGLSRGTVGQSILDRLGEVYDTQLAGFDTAATSAINNIRTSDASTLSDLLQQLNAGADFSSVQSSANTNLQNNVNQSFDQAKTMNLANLFAAMDELYGQSQYVDRYNQGVRYGSSGVVTPGSYSGGSYSGTVIH